MIVELDLHGKTYEEVEENLANWLIVQYNRGNLPIRVITGNSNKMKNIVYKICEHYEFEVGNSLDNVGVLVVRK
jgi:DNA-nicking Smr family endonuclease